MQNHCCPNSITRYTRFRNNVKIMFGKFLVNIINFKRNMSNHSDGSR